MEAEGQGRVNGQFQYYVINDRKSTYRVLGDPREGASNPDLQSGKTSWGKSFLGNDLNNVGRIRQIKDGEEGRWGWSWGGQVEEQCSHRKEQHSHRPKKDKFKGTRELPVTTQRVQHERGGSRGDAGDSSGDRLCGT